MEFKRKGSVLPAARVLNNATTLADHRTKYFMHYKTLSLTTCSAYSHE